MARKGKLRTAKDLTPKFIQLLEAKAKTFHENNRSLRTEEEKLFKSWLTLLEETYDTLEERSTSWRSTRVQARTLLCDIFAKIGPEVFLLCTLTTTISKLAEPNLRKNCVPALEAWWMTTTAPKRLTELASERCKKHSISNTVADLGSPEGEGE
jgi:hypothetical protein